MHETDESEVDACPSSELPFTLELINGQEVAIPLPEWSNATDTQSLQQINGEFAFMHDSNTQ
jgi:hypothetical protein